MTCLLSCSSSQEAYSRDHIKQAIINAGVLFGVDHQRIEEIVQDLNHKKEPIEKIIIARGLESTEGIDFILEPETLELRSQFELDWENKKVSKGDILFRVIASKKPHNGMNVLGEEIEARKVKTSPFQAGPYCSFNESKGTFKALANGSVSISDEGIVAIDFSSESDGQLVFHLSNDRRFAFLTCSPRESGPYQMEEAEEGMYAAKIIYGIDYDRIEHILEMVNSDGQTFQSEVIAKGDSGLDGSDSEVEYRYPVDEEQTCLVHDGDEIAVVRPGLPPREGLNVSGKKIKGRVGNLQPLKVGEGCIFNDRKQAYVALISGNATLLNGVLSITPIQDVEASLPEKVSKPELDFGTLEVLIDEDMMSAVLNCSAKEDGSYTMDEVKEALCEAGLVSGIYYEKLEGLIQRVNDDKNFWVWGEVIARGDTPVDGTDEYLNVYFWEDTVEDERIRFDPGFELSENMVQQDQAVASLRERNPPSYGMTVTGKNIIGQEGLPVDLKFSDDFYFDEESHLFKAGFEGKVFVDNSIVRIQPVLREQLVIERGLEEDSEEAQRLGAPLQLTVSRDFMVMTMYLRPRRSKPWEFYELEECVYEHDVVYGIEFERMEELMNKVNSENIVVEDEVIARGQAPQSGNPAKCVLHFSKEKSIDLEPYTLSQVLNSGEMGHEFVAEGDRVLEYLPAKSGQEGFTVTGEKLQPRDQQKSAMIAFKPGENLIPGSEKGTFVAKVPGQIQIRANTICIKPVLVIDEDISLRTGDIEFEGNLVIHGNVLTGMSIKVKGNAFIDGMVEQSTIQVGGDLSIINGIQGGPQGRKAVISVGGDLRSKFCNNAIVKCEGDMLIESSLLHSEVTCEGTIRILEQGRGIMGGRVRAMLGIETSNLGSHLGVATEAIVGGFNHDVKLKMAKLEGARQRLQKVVTSLMIRLNPYKGKENFEIPKNILAKINLVRKELAEALQKDKALLDEFEALERSLIDKSQIVLKIRDTVYPDVRIQIERSVMTRFYEPIHHCIFQEHATRPIVEVVPLHKSV